MQMDKLKLCLIAVVVFTQMASVAGRVYTDIDVGQFSCTSQSPVQAPDYYELTTGGVTVSFPLTHVFCGEIHQGFSETRATGFHSTAAQSYNNPSAKSIAGIHYVFNVDHWIQVEGIKTFFRSTSTVRGLSRCISMWAAECYYNNNYSGRCMYLNNIPNLPYNGIQVFFDSSGYPGQVTLSLRTAYPTNYNKCNACQIPQTLSTCNLKQ